ncbi:LysR family transcriptional regulator [Vibrio zhanjiangensis]|uniref:LysR family transcriptional regulator n=1 Tax=Vibrio zhanjiangensis TaxID=1046128 RepID=A0ABQ6F1L6_9VIBR|nr:LysR substrate-binding domain-containing protein [Vibrio zhanjiangensis]GLT18766.1 LysR family transcriptional regulator [Vibrio zhanjiangensis]
MKRPVPLKSVYSFVAVAETGSMTDASKLLNVSHSAISQSIKSLESQIGQALFIRQGRVVVLNSTGRQYYKQVAPALEQIIIATEKLIERPHSQRLTLNMVNSLVMHWWIPRVDQFSQYAPKVDIRLSSLTGNFKMETEGVDVAIIHGKTDAWSNYYCELLATDELVLTASPDLIDQDTTPASILKQYPAIIVTNDRRKHDWKIWCDSYKLPEPEYAQHLKFSVSVQAVQATIRKLGVFVSHKQFIRDEVDQGSLIEIGTPVLNPNQDFYFACPPEKLKNENVLLLRNWLRQEFRR